MPGQPVITPSRARFQRVLQAYVSARAHKDPEELLLRKARSASLDFYKSTLAAAPDPETIRRAVKARGWQVRRKAGAWPLKKGEHRGSDGPLRRMQGAVIGRRLKGRGAAATGWLPAVRKLGGQATGKRLVEVKNPKGRVEIDRPSPGVFRVTVVNSTPGIVHLEKTRQITRSGFNAGTKDMIKYLRQQRATGSGVGVGGNG